MKKIYIGTGNPNKVKEFSEMFEPFNIEIVSAFRNSDDAPEENGKTYIENARIKAVRAQELTGETALADDSGLSIDFLDGAPGLYSARFGGEKLSHPEKIKKILKMMEDVPEDKRSARFHCAIVLLYKNGDEKVFHSTCEGKIGFSPQGNGGFGFDPIFIPENYDKSFAQLGSEIKNNISHRGKSFKKLIEYLNSI